jgi:hypothetical protein
MDGKLEGSDNGIPCECGGSYVAETGRPLAVRIREHMQNLKQGLLEKSKLAQHAYEEGHRVGWDQASVLEISNSRYRKYKESAHMACSINPISQSRLEISPIWIPLINEEINKSKWKSVRLYVSSVTTAKFCSKV